MNKACGQCTNWSNSICNIFSGCYAEDCNLAVACKMYCDGVAAQLSEPEEKEIIAEPVKEVTVVDKKSKKKGRRK